MRIFAFQDVLYGLDIIVQMHTAEYSAEGDEKGMLHLIDDLPTLYLNYFTGVVPWRKSFIWDLFSAIPWNRIGCALNQPPVEGARLPPAVVFLALDLCRMFKMYRLQVVMPLQRGRRNMGLLEAPFSAFHHLPLCRLRVVPRGCGRRLCIRIRS